VRRPSSLRSAAAARSASSSSTPAPTVLTRVSVPAFEPPGYPEQRRVISRPARWRHRHHPWASRSRCRPGALSPLVRELPFCTRPSARGNNTFEAARGPLRLRCLAEQTRRGSPRHARDSINDTELSRGVGSRAMDERSSTVVTFPQKRPPSRRGRRIGDSRAKAVFLALIFAMVVVLAVLDAFEIGGTGPLSTALSLR
jgi:hypothetical protein